MIGLAMTIATFWAYTSVIVGRTGGSWYKGMFFSSQATWAGTTFVGIWAFTSSNYALGRFWHMFQYTEYGVYWFNWLGLLHAQYMREMDGNYSFTSSLNLIAFGINIIYNLASFVLVQELHAYLCDNDQYLYAYCYDFSF